MVASHASRRAATLHHHLFRDRLDSHAPLNQSSAVDHNIDKPTVLVLWKLENVILPSKIEKWQKRPHLSLHCSL
jgi:hypothetical protein